jgi:2-hydroxychromene-2-carboxylate isomerase
MLCTTPAPAGSDRFGSGAVTEFQEQGGFATMDPSGLRRWLTSFVMTRLNRPGRVEKAQARAERERVARGEPHRLEFFHQVDDPYSHLAAQCLRPLVQRYGVELVPYIVPGPGGANLPEPDLLPALACYDAALVAPQYGLRYPADLPAPDPALCRRAEQVLTAVDPARFPEAAVELGEALIAADEAAIDRLAGQYGEAEPATAAETLAAGAARRAELKHYAGAMFYYGSQWYWGVDRLYHLEKRWRELGLGGDEPPLYPRPAVEFGSYKANGSLTLEFYASLRSPYTAIVFDQAVELAERTGVRLDLRPVVPMVMRGVSLSREKGMYIFADTYREAQARGVTDFGYFYDPIGRPVRRCYSLFSWAKEQGKHVALMSSFLKAAFREGINTNRDSGLRRVVERAGLSWEEARSVIDNDDWQALLEENRNAMYAFGSWGVPTFRLLDARGNTIAWAWGQDRLWLIAREIQRVLIQA